MRLAHNRTEVELYELAPGRGRALLLLHALYGSSADWGEGLAPWPGPVYALDFGGHGRSQWHKGGAYTPELLACNVDEALRQIGPAVLVGAGIGAYVGLLVAGARRDVVPAALVLPGLGDSGGGILPHAQEHIEILTDVAVSRGGADPMVCFLERDIRPLDYIAPFARKANRLVLVENGGDVPTWWETVRAVAGVRSVSDVGAGLASL